jgi:hypothetical protein
MHLGRRKDMKLKGVVFDYMNAPENKPICTILTILEALRAILMKN